MFPIVRLVALPGNNVYKRAEAEYEYLMRLDKTRHAVRDIGFMHL